MNIAYILNIFPRLYQTFILNDMAHLKRQGHDIYVFSAGKPYDNIFHGDAVAFSENTVYFSDLVNETMGKVNQYIFKFALRTKKYNPIYEKTIQYIFHEMSNKGYDKKYFKDLDWRLHALPSVANALIKKEIDVIHAGFGSNESTYAMIMSEMTRIPFTFETHAKDLFVKFPFADEKIRKAQRLFTISEYNKKYLTEHLRCPPSKIVVKRVSCNRTYCDQISLKGRKDNLILSVCRLDSIKGLEYAIEAFSKVVRKRNDLKYVIIGDGPLRGDLTGQVERLSLSEKVSFPGNVTNEQVLNLIAQATIVLMPSVIAQNGDRDGIPTALIEAMYMKTPVISSRVSGIPELIDDGMNGFLTESGDVDQIAGKMERLLSDESLRTRMGDLAREKVDREFNIEDNVNKLISAWKDITSEAAGRSNKGTAFQEIV